MFRWILTQRRPIRAREVADHFGITLYSATAVLGRIRNRGGIIRQGYTHRAIWLIWNEDAEMGSWTGMHPNSLNNLRIQWKRTTGNSHPKTKQSKDWSGATELEKCWALTTLSMDSNTD